MQDFKKIVRVGKTADGNAFAKIEYKAGKLSISGVIGPMSNGDCLGSCGQWVMSMAPQGIDPAPGWTAEIVQLFLQYWDKWHLNDLQAGSPAQMAELEKHKFPGYPKSYYEWAQEILLAAKMNPAPDYIHNGKPYFYGSAWLTVPVPAEVLEFLQGLPDTDITPAWV